MAYLLPLLLCVAAAATIQTVSSFGFAIFLMPLAILIVGLRTAVPLVALLGVTISIVNAVRTRKSVDMSEVPTLGIFALVGVPIGVWVLGKVDARVVEAGLGILLIAYGAYSLLNPQFSRAIGRRWGYPVGFIAGCLGGAYNLPGPPLILYGSLRRWSTDSFRATLQTVVAIFGPLVIISHAIAGHIDLDLLRLFALAVPAFVLGVVVGSRIVRHLDPTRARQVINVLILVLGVSLFF
ncbi:MAG: sulfite exporter TauE/SafE family protein [Anaerolineae bacterium]